MSTFQNIARTLDCASSLTTKSTNEELTAALALSAVRGAARRVLVSLCATIAGATRVAEILTAYATLDAAAIQAHAKARAAGTKAETPECLSMYVQVRRMAEQAGHAFTIGKRGGASDPCFIPQERQDANARSAAAKGPRASRKVTEPRADLTDAQALKQIRALLHLNSTSARDTVAAVAALIAPAPAGKLPRAASVVAKRA